VFFFFFWAFCVFFFCFFFFLFFFFFVFFFLFFWAGLGLAPVPWSGGKVLSVALPLACPTDQMPAGPRRPWSRASPRPEPPGRRNPRVVGRLTTGFFSPKGSGPTLEILRGAGIISGYSKLVPLKGFPIRPGNSQFFFPSRHARAAFRTKAIDQRPMAPRFFSAAEAHNNPQPDTSSSPRALVTRLVRCPI